MVFQLCHSFCNFQLKFRFQRKLSLYICLYHLELQILILSSGLLPVTVITYSDSHVVPHSANASPFKETLVPFFVSPRSFFEKQFAFWLKIFQVDLVLPQLQSWIQSFRQGGLVPTGGWCVETRIWARQLCLCVLGYHGSQSLSLSRPSEEMYVCLCLCTKSPDMQLLPSIYFLIYMYVKKHMSPIDNSNFSPAPQFFFIFLLSFYNSLLGQ